MAPLWGLFRSYLPHSNLELRTIFLWNPCSLRNILSKFKIFSQPTWPIPKVSVQLEFIGAGSNTEHLSLFRQYLPHPNSELCTIFLWTPCSSRNILPKFQICSRPDRPIPKVSVQSKFIGACLNTEHLGLFQSYLPHPNSESCTVFFYGLIVLQGIFFQNLKYFLNRLNQSPKFQFSQNSLEHVWIQSTWACFDHISLIRTWNRALFFLWTPCSSRNILSKFQIFSRPTQPIGNRFVGPACIEHWFW